MIRRFRLAAMVTLLATPAFAVVGGQDASDPSGARRYTVGVMTTYGEICSGIVVSPKLVLTAAHCLVRGKALYVMALDPSFNPRQFKARKSWRNPRFAPGVVPLKQRGSDIGMIELASPLPPDMQPIAIAASAAEISGASELHIAGFGVSRYGDRSTAGQLREARLTPIGLARSGVVNLYASESGALGESRVSACLGDSGGPVVVGGASPVLVGVISWVGAQAGGRNCEGITVAAPTVLDEAGAGTSLARFRQPRHAARRSPPPPQRLAAPDPMAPRGIDWSSR